MFNEAIKVRPDEVLDVSSLADFLRTRIPTPFDSIEVFQFPSGNSNLTYLIRLGRVEFVLRRPPFGNTVAGAHDMKREFDVLSRLSKMYPPAPEPILFCDDRSVIGAEFYLMERLDGIILRGTIDPNHFEGKTSKLITDFNSSPDMQRKVCGSFIENLARLHRVDHKFAGLDKLGKPEGYCRRQVVGWTQRYEAAKTHQHSELEAAMKWLNENIPAEFGATLVHNDYKFDNIMLDPEDLTRIVAVLDWEMVTIGDPLMDLGTTLGYWMSPEFGEEMMQMPFNPYVLMSNISRQELVDLYAELSGRDVSGIMYHYVFGTFKIAVIAQQIYARFVKGATKDQRFANFDRFVSALGRIAAKAIGSGKI